MKKKFLKMAVAFLAAGLTVTAASCGNSNATGGKTTTITANDNNNNGGDNGSDTNTEVKKGNQLEDYTAANYDLSNNGKGWCLFANDAADGAIAVEEDGSVKVDVNKVCDANWKVQLLHYGLTLVKGTNYKLSYKVKSADIPQITSTVDSGDPDYACYYTKTVKTGAEFTEYTFYFNMTADSNTAARLTFALGDVGVGTLYFTDLVLEAVDEIPAQPEEPEDETPGDDTPGDDTPEVVKNTVNFSAENTYTCTNEAGKSVITYASVDDNSYKTVYADLATLAAGKTKVTFTIKNNGAENVQFNIDLGFNNDGVKSQITNKSDFDWFDESNNRAQVNVGAGGSRTVTIIFTNTEEAPANAMIMFINSCYAETPTTHTDGNIEILDMVFDTVTE